MHRRDLIKYSALLALPVATATETNTWISYSAAGTWISPDTYRAGRHTGYLRIKEVSPVYNRSHIITLDSQTPAPIEKPTLDTGSRFALIWSSGVVEYLDATLTGHPGTLFEYPKESVYRYALDLPR